jgi:predicted DCC family thiol-disulfide oxidoreductase YuxK
MRTATVLYDADCALCRRARAWLESQEQLLRLEFVPAASAEAQRRYPSLGPQATLRDLTVVADTGEVWRAERAWVLCLWACAEHRSKAERLANPAMLPLARKVFGAISDNREWIGSIHG